MGCAPSSTRNITTHGVSTHSRTDNSTTNLTNSVIFEKEDKVFAEKDDSDYSLIVEDQATINSMLDFLENQTDYATQEIMESYLLRLSMFYNPKTEGKKTKQLADYLADRYPSLYIHIIDQLHKRNNIFNWEKNSDIMALYSCYCATSVLWNTCDASPKMCKEVGKAGIIAIIVEDLKAFKAYSTSTSTHELTDRYLGSLLATTHNIVRNYDGNRHYARDAGAVKLLQHYLALEKILYRSYALLSLSYIVNEKENDKINTGNENIQFFVDMLESAVEATDHRETVHNGFHTTELVAGMTKLAVNDSNKMKLVEQGILPPLYKLLQSDCTHDEQRLAACALWTLAFKKENVDKIRKYPGVVDALSKLQKSAHRGVREACDGALWELGETTKGEKPLDESDKSRQGHIMISYNWDVQKRMIKLKDKLKSKGYNVWMDIEKMGGSTLEAMANAVQGADVVLICMSEKYKFSNSCRSEAEYTYKLEKPFIPLKVQSGYQPDGWLGIMLGTKLYYDFSTENRLEENFPDLVKALGDQGKRDELAVAKQEFNTNAAPSSINIGPSTKPNDVKSWNNDDVKNWLRDYELGHLTPKFAKYDGYKLLTMKTLSIKAPEFFYGSLDKKLGIRDMYDIVTFTAAIEEL